MNKPLKYDGYVWIELLPLAGLAVDDLDGTEEDEVAASEILGEFLMNNMSFALPECEAFMDALLVSEDSIGYSSPLYRGWQKIEDQEEKMTWFVIMLKSRMLWS